MKNNILAIALLSALSTSAMAEGAYVAVDVGQSTAKDACTGTAAAGISCNEKATAFRFGGGYQFTPNFGIEASYGILGSVKASSTDTSIPGAPITINMDIKPTTLQVAATGHFPITDAFSLIGKLGIARTTLKLNATGSFSGVTVSIPEQSSTSTNPAFGIGGQYDFSKNIGVRAQYENFGEVGDDVNTPKFKLSLISAGLVLKF